MGLGFRDQLDSSMSDSVLFTFRIDGLSPETLGMKDLSRYLSDLSDLLGKPENVHFKQVDKGSAELKWWPDKAVEGEVRDRLVRVSHYHDDEEIRSAVLSLNKRLANDNSSAEILDPTGAPVADFPGKNFREFATVPAFWQDDTIQGQLIRIGGKDESIHAHFNCDGKIVTKVTLDRKTAKKIVQYFLGPTLRLSGKARWSRTYLGEWNLLLFKVQAFEVLEDESLFETIEDIGRILSDKIGENDDPFANLSDKDLQ